MKITNKYGLSQCWVDAVKLHDHVHGGKLSMTELITPPRVTLLRKRHDDEIEEDVVDRIWALLGTAIHDLLAKVSARDPSAVAQQRFEVKLLNELISLEPDRVERMPVSEAQRYWREGLTEPELVNGVYYFPVGTTLHRLRDFKITQVYARNSLTEDGKDEWRLQVNGYAWGLWQLGIYVPEAAIELLMKDWQWLDANVKHTAGYPPVQVEAVPVALMPMSEIEAYLKHRLQMYLDCWDQPDDELPFCSMAERWATPDRFAVKKAGGEKALPGAADLASMSEAKLYIEERLRKDAEKKKPDGLTEKSFEVEFRPGESKRCERYCAARPFCSQYATQVHPPF